MVISLGQHDDRVLYNLGDHGLSVYIRPPIMEDAIVTTSLVVVGTGRANKEKAKGARDGGGGVRGRGGG